MLDQIFMRSFTPRVGAAESGSMLPENFQTDGLKIGKQILGFCCELILPSDENKNNINNQTTAKNGA